MNDPNAASVTRTLRLKVRAESYGWLNVAAVEVNQVWNWANATSADAAGTLPDCPLSQLSPLEAV